MSKRRRRTLIGRSPTSGSAPARAQPHHAEDAPHDDGFSDDAEREASQEPHASVASDEEGPDTSDECQGEPWPETDAMDPPDIAPPMMIEDAMPAPEHSRDLAAVEKQTSTADELFTKKVETANPAPQRTDAGDAFPKEFEEEDDWFMKTGQPAPQRVELQPSARPAGTSEANPWPLVIGLLVVAGLVGLVGVLLVALRGM